VNVTKTPGNDGGGFIEDPIARGVLQSVRKVIQAVDRRSRELVQRWGLTGPQLVVLQELALRGETSAGELARAASLSQATVTGILDRLEERELVTRRRSEDDRRVVVVRPTRRCWRVLKGTPSPLGERFVERFARLEAWERTQVWAALERLVSLMDQRDEAVEERLEPTEASGVRPVR